MKFSEIPNWGYVDDGTKIIDTSGNKYVVGEQNDKGFVPLGCFCLSPKKV